MYWDESAIIKIMDEAMLKYKIMHGQEVLRVSAEGGGGGVLNGCGKSDEPKRNVEDEIDNEANSVEFEVNETANTSEANGNINLESCPTSSTDFLDALNVKETQQEPIEHSNLNLKVEESYNQLLQQYYELEEKRQKVLEQLYRYSWNYQDQDANAGSDIGTQWATSSAYQEHTVSASQPYDNHAIASYWPSSYPTLSGAHSSSVADDDIIKTAMDSAARAISSISMKTVNKEKENEGHDEIKPQGGASSETDLPAVLNAWYSAGFYTGKYLVEQSNAKK